MTLEIHLSTDERAAISKVAKEVGCSIEDATKICIRAWLIEKGYLDSETADNDNEDTETVGEA